MPPAQLARGFFRAMPRGPAALTEWSAGKQNYLTNRACMLFWVRNRDASEIDLPFVIPTYAISRLLAKCDGAPFRSAKARTRSLSQSGRPAPGSTAAPPFPGFSRQDAWSTPFDRVKPDRNSKNLDHGVSCRWGFPATRYHPKPVVGPGRRAR